MTAFARSQVNGDQLSLVSIFLIQKSFQGVKQVSRFRSTKALETPIAGTSGSDTYYNAWATSLKDGGHELVATGHLKFDDGVEVEHVISKSDGSLYLSCGVVTSGSTRIFLGRGPDEESFEAMVVEWTQHSIGTPIDLEREFATVMYERVNPPATPGPMNSQQTIA